MNIIPKWALEASIKGGWSTNVPDKFIENGDWYKYVLLEPDFWQCLGKELGWKECKCGKACMIQPDWYDNAHRLYDLILSRAPQEDIDAYWEALRPK